MADFLTVLSVISEAGGDRDAFAKAYQARLAKGNAQPEGVGVDPQTFASVMKESGGDRDAFIAAYSKRLAKGNAQPAPSEPTPTRKGDSSTRALARIIVEAERVEDQERQDADLIRRLAALDIARANAKTRTITEKGYTNPYTYQSSLNEPRKATRNGNTELRESIGGNLGRIVGRRE